MKLPLLVTAMALVWCGRARALCRVRRVDKAACVLDVSCYGELRGEPAVPLACLVPHRVRVRLVLRGLGLPPTHCPPFLDDVYTVVTAGSRWSVFPKDLLACTPRLQLLQLHNNLIPDIPPKAFTNLTSLRFIDLKANQISNIAVDALADTPKLERLFLSQNQLKTLHGGIFEKNVMLKELDLSYNLLLELHSDTFRGLKNLIILKLNNNKILFLNGALKRLRTLEHLHLRSNKLHDVDIRELPYSHQLKTLDIANNTLSAIPPEVFARYTTNSVPQMSASTRNSVTNPATTDQEPVVKILLSRNKIMILENASFTSAIATAKSRPTRHNYVEVEDVKNSLTGKSTETEIDLSYNLIELIQFDAFTGIERLIALDLSSNKLTVFLVNTTNLNHLSRLNLKNNQLNNIDAQTFYKLPKLSRIDFSGNKIALLQKNTPWTPAKLVVLNLSKNNLTELRGDMFGELDSMQELDVSGNTLTVVEIGTQHLSGLRRLDLSSNNINDLNAVRLHYLLELNVLDLSRNGITKVTRATFAHVPALKRLDLSSNRIEEIAANAFDSLPGLTKLDLSDNNLTHLHFGVLSGLRKLEELDISHNSISRLESRVMFDLQSLSRLNLEGNMLSEMDVDVWKGRRIAVLINVGGNRLSCAWVANVLSDARQGWSGVWLTSTRDPAIAYSDSAPVTVGGISCVVTSTQEPNSHAALQVATAPQAASITGDERLLYTNQKILNAILMQTSELKKGLKFLLQTSKRVAS